MSAVSAAAPAGFLIPLRRFSRSRSISAADLGGGPAGIRGRPGRDGKGARAGAAPGRRTAVAAPGASGREGAAGSGAWAGAACAPPSVACAAGECGAAAGRSLTGMVLMRGSMRWMSWRGRVGRSGLSAGRRCATPRFGSGAGSSRRMTSRGPASFLPWRMAWIASVSMIASSPSTRTPIDFSLNTRSWFAIPMSRASS